MALLMFFHYWYLVLVTVFQFTSSSNVQTTHNVSGRSILDTVSQQIHQQIQCVDAKTMCQFVKWIDFASTLFSYPLSDELKYTAHCADGCSLMINQIFISIMKRYQNMDNFTGLKTTMILMMNQATKYQSLNMSIMDVNVWNEFFKAYFNSRNTCTIKRDKEFCQYLGMMTDLKIKPDIHTMNTIITGINYNHQIKDPASVIRIIFDEIMIDHNIQPNMITYEQVMHSFSHNKNCKQAITFWQEINDNNQTHFKPSKKLLKEYLNIYVNYKRGAWRYFVNLMYDTFKDETIITQKGYLIMKYYANFYHNHSKRKNGKFAKFFALLNKIKYDTQIFTLVLLYTTKRSLSYDYKHQFYLLILIKYEALQSFGTLKATMDIIIKQNKTLNVLDVKIWNQFFKLYFMSNGTQIVQYLQQMDALKIKPDINTFSIILEGLKRNETKHYLSGDIYGQICNKLMELCSEIGDIESANKLWYEMKEFGLVASNELIKDYMVLRSKSLSSTWDNFERLMELIFVNRSDVDSIKYFNIYSDGFINYNKIKLVPQFLDHHRTELLTTNDTQLFAVTQKFIGLCKLQ